MRKFNKFFSVFAMIALLVTSLLPVSVFAGNITLTPPAGHTLDPNDFTVYKIFDMEELGGLSSEDRYVYTLVPQLKVLETELNQYLNQNENLSMEWIDYTTPESGDGQLAAYIRHIGDQYLVDPNSPSPEYVKCMSDLANAIYGFIDTHDGGSLKSALSAGISYDGGGYGNVPVTITTPDSGYYLIFSEKVTNNESGAYAAFYALGTTDNDNLDVTFKASAPSIKKMVHGQGGDDQYTSATIGTTVDFEIIITVPNISAYDTYVLKVHDTMTPGLKLNSAIDYDAPSNVQVDANAAIGSSDFNIHFVFNSEAIKSTPIEGTRIHITYSAIVTEEIIDIMNATNGVTLEYSNNPSTNGLGIIDPDPNTGTQTTVYTYDVDVFKYTNSDNIDGVGGDPLAGAEFELYDELQQEIKVVELPPNINYPESEVLYRPWIAEDGTSSIITSPQNGKFTIIGLGEGLYTLTETKAPEGYNVAAPIEFEIISNKEDKTLRVNSNQTERINVFNRAGILLPSTGGIGTTIFTIAGATMVGAGLVALVIFRKKIFGSK